jgi:glycosyltransferase involved in cell wall biosynthesis
MSDGKIRVLRIIARLNVGGPAIHTILLTSALNDDAYESVLLCGSVDEGEKDMSYLAEEKGVKPLIIGGLGRKLDLMDDIRAFRQIYRYIKDFKPDIVHTHTAKAGALGRAAAVMAGVPVRIHTFHGHIFDGYFGRLKTWVFLSIERTLALFTRYIIVVSEAQKRDISGKYKIAGEKKVRAISLGLELSKFAGGGCHSGIRERFGISAGAIVVSIAGRLVPIKNHKMFLDAAKRLVASAPGLDVKFLVVGDGEQRPALERCSSESGLGDRVVFCGWQEDMCELYSGSDIIALTSLNEGTPVAVIEAMASGKPVVATDVGGVRDVVEDGVTGYLVASGDASGFSQKLMELASDKDKRESFGRAGRASVMSRYSKERLVGDIKRLYSEALMDYNKAKKGV